MPFIDGLGVHVNDWWHVSDGSNVITQTDCHSRLGLASKHALDERCGFDEPVCPREARCLQHHVIHMKSYLLLGNNHVGSRGGGELARHP
jgi:hypothetical protein